MGERLTFPHVLVLLRLILTRLSLRRLASSPRHRCVTRSLAPFTLLAFLSLSICIHI